MSGRRRSIAMTAAATMVRVQARAGRVRAHTAITDSMLSSVAGISQHIVRRQHGPAQAPDLGLRVDTSSARHTARTRHTRTPWSNHTSSPALRKPRPASPGAGAYARPCWPPLLLLAVTGGFAAYAVLMLPDVDPWHTIDLDDEFTAGDERGLDFAGYQAIEQKLFDAERAAVARDADRRALLRRQPLRPARPGAPARTGTTLQPQQPPHAVDGARRGAADSRPLRLAVLDAATRRRALRARLRGDGPPAARTRHAALRHGPHGLRGLGGRHACRRPRHQRAPAAGPALLHRRLLDRRLARAHVRTRSASTPGADTSLRPPTRVLLFSAAVELVPAAALTPILDMFAKLPFDAFEKVNWQSIGPEYDPYKFVSFPVNASRQVYHATRRLQRSLLDAEQAGRLGQLASVVAFQSAVDSTVGTHGVADDGVRAAEGRPAPAGPVRRQPPPALRPRAPAGVHRARARRDARHGRRHASAHAGARHQPRSVDTDEVELREYAPGQATPVVTAPGLAWLPSLVSVGHVSVPFPPDDPHLRLPARQRRERRPGDRLVGPARRGRRHRPAARRARAPARQPVLARGQARARRDCGRRYSAAALTAAFGLGPSAMGLRPWHAGMRHEA